MSKLSFERRHRLEQRHSHCPLPLLLHAHRGVEQHGDCRRLLRDLLRCLHFHPLPVRDVRAVTKEAQAQGQGPKKEEKEGQEHLQGNQLGTLDRFRNSHRHSEPAHAHFRDPDHCGTSDKDVRIRAQALSAADCDEHNRVRELLLVHLLLLQAVIKNFVCWIYYFFFRKSGHILNFSHLKYTGIKWY